MMPAQAAQAPVEAPMGYALPLGREDLTSLRLSPSASSIKASRFRWGVFLPTQAGQTFVTASVSYPPPLGRLTNWDLTSLRFNRLRFSR